MSRKRDRRKGPPNRRADPPEVAAPTAPPPERRSRGILRDPGVSPVPAFGVTIRAAARAVLTSPAVLALALLAPLAFWGIFVALGVEPLPPNMVMLVALPPVNVSLDASLVALGAESGIASTAQILGAAALRAGFIALLSVLILRRLDDSASGDIVRRLPRVAWVLFLVLAVEFALVFLVPIVLQAFGGPALYQIGILAAIILGLHYLGFALVIPAAEERVAPADALRLSARASRFPGPRHLLLVVAYFSFVFWASSIVPVGEGAPVTPAPVVWAFALVAAVVHAIVLAAFAVRWLAVRDQVPRGSRRAAA